MKTLIMILLLSTPVFGADDLNKPIVTKEYCLSIGKTFVKESKPNAKGKTRKAHCRKAKPKKDKVS